MTGMFAVMGIVLTTHLMCTAYQKKSEEYLAASFILISLLLYPFYCMDSLRLGRYVVYAVFGFVAVHSVLRICRENDWKMNRSVMIRLIPSPGLCVFAVLAAVCYLVLHDRLVSLWDELRLWGAVPKAMYATERLQLGEDALIFSNMQSYPPAMPLLVYFITALAPNFPEYQIFVIYALFFFSLLLPMLADLKWRQWPLFPIFGILFFWLPCVFTSHDGDFCRFYNSLFIDPILGGLAGYVFYLSATKLYESKWTSWRFAMALAYLILLKDTGILFAVFAVINSVFVYISKKSCQNIWKKAMLSLVPGLLCFVIWKLLLDKYNIASTSSSHLEVSLLTLDSIRSLLKHCWEDMIFYFDIAAVRVQLSLVPCGLILAGVLCRRNGEQSQKKIDFISFVSIITVCGIFSVGNCLSFGSELPSFQRYMSSLLTCILVFMVLRGVSGFLEQKNRENTSCMNRRSVIAAVVVGTVLLGFSVPEFQKWSEKRNVSTIDEKAMVQQVVKQIEKNEAMNPQENSRYYLMISEGMVNHSRLHHRIYLELLTTSAQIKNFYNDTNIIGAQEIPENWDMNLVREETEEWLDQLTEGQYDYVYVYSLHAFTKAAMQRITTDEIVAENIYKIVYDNDAVRLQKVMPDE